MKNCMYLLLAILMILPNCGKLFALDSKAIDLTPVVMAVRDSAKDAKVKKRLEEIKAKQQQKDTLENDTAAAKKKLKEHLKRMEEKRNKSAYEKLFLDKAFETVRGKFITLHKIDQKFYFEIPLEYMEREMLLSTTASKTSSSELAAMAYRNTVHVRFRLIDSLVYLQEINTTTTYDKKEKSIKSAVEDNTLDVVTQYFKVAARTPDKKAVVIEVTKLFLEQNNYMNVFQRGIGFFGIFATMPRSMAVVKSMKTFDDNLTVKVVAPYDVKLTFFGFPYALLKATVETTTSLLLLPEDKMRPRKSDSRVGIFLTDKRHFTTEEDGVGHYSVAHRWRLEPKDVKAYKQGKLVEPVKPIVWYVDTAFPKDWVGPIKKAVLRWNAAFEKIGFKNVMQVRDFPKNDTLFDADNVKYSCIRYLPTTTANAMGPSYVDPETGEIISASVLVYSNIVQIINNWRFVQTAQVDPLVRHKKMPKKIMDESIEYVVAHEIGHTLGFMHNMAASSAIPVESLRSAEFTKKHGTTPSIMDYARFNYVAQPGDKGVKLTPPTLGVYDYYLVRWNYEYFPNAKSMEEEAEILEKMVDSKAGDPMYRYGRQQLASRYDPSALEEDLGDDPMKAGDYGIKNLKYILAHMDEWIEDDPDGSHKYSLYLNICNQYYRYIRNVMYNIGGIYLTDVKEGTPGERFVAVSKAKQKASLQWVVNEFRNSGWLKNEKLLRKLPMGVNMDATIQRALSLGLLNLYEGVLLSSHVSKDPYTVEEFFDDYYNLAFESIIKDAPLTEGDKMLQLAAVRAVANKFTDKKGGGLLGVTSLQEAYKPSLDDIIAYGLDESGLINQFADRLRTIDFENMSREQQQKEFGAGYGWQRKVSVYAIDNSEVNLYTLGKRIQRLLESKLGQVSGETLAHYEALLFMLERRLEK